MARNISANISVERVLAQFCASTEKRPKWVNRSVCVRHLELYVDSNFAGDPEHRRSRYGYVIFLNENPIDFGTGLQKRTAASTPEAEYIALARGLKELLWVGKYSPPWAYA